MCFKNVKIYKTDIYYTCVLITTSNTVASILFIILLQTLMTLYVNNKKGRNIAMTLNPKKKESNE